MLQSSNICNIRTKTQISFTAKLPNIQFQQQQNSEISHPTKHAVVEEEETLLLKANMSTPYKEGRIERLKQKKI